MIVLLLACSSTPTPDERCNGIDDDGDGQVDEGVGFLLYADADGDGWGTGNATRSCAALPLGVSATGDCDDSAASVYPGAEEVCNNLDDDCDGEVDAGLTATWYADTDADGFGDATTALAACDAPAAWIAEAGDCNDQDATIQPNASEGCDGVDQDCDGVVDNGVLIDVYFDGDGDGYGDLAIHRAACAPDETWRIEGTDCDDERPDVHPAATEVCNDLADTNCDGLDGCRLEGDINLLQADATYTLGWSGREDSCSPGPDLVAGELTGDTLDDLLIGRPGSEFPYAAYDGGAGSWDIAWVRGGGTVLDGFPEAVGLYASAPYTAVLDDDAWATMPSWRYEAQNLGEVAIMGHFNSASSLTVLLLDPDDTVVPQAARTEAPVLESTEGFADTHQTDGIATLGDVDGDGLDEFWVEREDQDVLGSDASWYTVIASGPVDQSVSLPDLAVAGFGPTTRATHLAGCDVDQDGYADPLVVGEETGGLAVWLGLPAVVMDLSAPNLLFATEYGVSASLCADVTADGYTDLVVGIGPEPRRVAVHAGPITASADLSTDPAWEADSLDAGFGSALAAADVDADGFLDILVGESSVAGDLGAIHLFYGPANPPSTAGAAHFVIDGDDGQLGDRLAGADFNGDGFGDLAVSWVDDSFCKVGLVYGRGL